MSTLSFCNRNIKHYIREPGNVIFSFLSVFIIVALYILFLAQVQINSMENIVGATMDMELVVVQWMIGGLVCIPVVSVPLMVLSFKIDDVVDGIQDDLLVAPSKRFSLVLGYILSAWILGFLMSIVTLLLGEGYILLIGGDLISLGLFFEILLILAITILAFTGFLYLIISFMKARSSSMILSSIMNTLIGFFAGLYIPIGELSDSVAVVIKAFPLAQAAALIRERMLRETMDKLFVDSSASRIQEFKQYYGIQISIGENILTTTEILLGLIILGVFCYLISVFLLYKIKRK